MLRKSIKVVNVGISLLLVVFIILALVTFAVMSAVSASRDYKASQNAAARTSEYYDASNLAEKKLAQIDSLLAQAYDTDKSLYPQSAHSKLLEIEGVSVTAEDDGFRCSYTLPVSNTQELLVELLIPGIPAEYFCTRVVWKEQPINQWQADNSVNLIQ